MRGGVGQGTHVWIGKWEIQEIIVSRVCRGLGNGGGRGMRDENLFSDVLNPTAGLCIQYTSSHFVIIYHPVPFCDVLQCTGACVHQHNRHYYFIVGQLCFNATTGYKIEKLITRAASRDHI